MEARRAVCTVLEKCDFLYDDALLSKETIIRQYLDFFARQFDPAVKSVSFGFHTGSMCFDVVSVAALMVGCLAYGFSSNDEILEELKIGDMVLYQGERYRWAGIEKIDRKPGGVKKKYIILKQDGKGKNGEFTLTTPYENSKHLVRPYSGTSSLTDGRGIRKNVTNRNDFLSYVLGIKPSEVPTTFNLSVVVVADKNKFIDICRHLIIRYKGNKTVGITDVVPVSYYTGSEVPIQIGKNTSKAEPVIKVTSKISVARDLVLDRSGNRVIGLMVTNMEASADGSAELKDLLRRKTLKFSSVIAPFDPKTCELAMEQYENANIFACTKEVLAGPHHKVKVSNKLTEELNRQISNILTCKKETILVDSSCSWKRFRTIKELLYQIKQSDWAGEDRDNFLLSSMALMNLFGTAFFSMRRMEDAVSAKEISPAVVSPEARITEIMDIATRTESMRERCSEIATGLLEMYSFIYDSSPKEDALVRYLQKYPNGKTVLIVPKAYYAEIFNKSYHKRFPNVTCVTANRFDRHERYDRIVATGDIVGKRFDAVTCYTAPRITLFLYEYEERLFSFRKRKADNSENKLNARIQGLKVEEYVGSGLDKQSVAPDIEENIVHEFSDLDDYIASMGVFDIRKYASGSGNGGDNGNTAEVRFVGTFTTGEQILFSKYYTAVVFNRLEGAITETVPEKLRSGDILVFTRINDYTRNIVDQIFDQLMKEKKLSSDVQDAAEKAYYWKAALREYKDMNRLTYRAVTQELKKHGSTVQEMAVRQWLMDESHVIGPRTSKTMKTVAEVTGDPYLLRDPDGYFNACRIVRHYRREILSLIAQAINEKLSNRHPANGSAFEVVYKNVEKLSETMELENVFELEDKAVVNVRMVNRPISESEVLI